jgi:hypothetical protein
MSASGDTRHLHITFYIDPIENPAKSRAEGRPIYEEREMVEIKFVGDTKRILVALAHEKCTRDPATGKWASYAEIYHRHYDAFRTGEKAKGEGTPIEELTFINAARRAELKALNIHTVEALSLLEGSNLANLGMFGRELKEKAKTYIDKATDSALADMLIEENAKLLKRLEALEAQQQGQPQNGQGPATQTPASAIKVSVRKPT